MGSYDGGGGGGGDDDGGGDNDDEGVNVYVCVVFKEFNEFRLKDYISFSWPYNCFAVRLTFHQIYDERIK
jgi:hypothetical protein